MVGTINRAKQASGSTLIGLGPPFRKYGRTEGTDKMKKIQAPSKILNPCRALNN